MIQSCKSCLYYKPNYYSGSGPGAGAVCVRFPPTFHDIKNTTKGEYRLSTFPNVGSSEWCGEYREAIVVTADRNTARTPATVLGQVASGCLCDRCIPELRQRAAKELKALSEKTLVDNDDVA